MLSKSSPSLTSARSALARTRGSVLAHLLGLARDADCANVLANSRLLLSLAAGLRAAPDASKERCVQFTFVHIRITFFFAQ